jgi:hypothetical protein
MLSGLQDLSAFWGAYPMFCVLYKFTVKPGYQDHFRFHWSAVTQWLYHNAGSLGSRLHRASTGENIAYAQWQTRVQWEQQRERSDTGLHQQRQAMRGACTDIQVLYELDVVDDWLRGEVYGVEECP